MRTSQEVLLADVEQAVDIFRLFLRGRTMADANDMNHALQIQLQDLEGVLRFIADRHRTLTPATDIDEENEDACLRILQCISSTVQNVIKPTATKSSMTAENRQTEQLTMSLQLHSKNLSNDQSALLP